MEQSKEKPEVKTKAVEYTKVLEDGYGGRKRAGKMKREEREERFIQKRRRLTWGASSQMSWTDGLWVTGEEGERSFLKERQGRKWRTQGRLRRKGRFCFIR
jgi:hypothetical protein